EELSGLGIDNHVAVKSRSAFEAFVQAKNIPHIGLPFTNTLDVRTAWAIRNYCRKAGVDIVHMHSAKSHGIAVLSAALGNKTPLILSRRVDFIPKSNALTRWRYYHKSIRKIVGVSHKITEIMRAYTGDAEKCVTVHSGIDPAKFERETDRGVLKREYGIAPGTVVIGNTAALEHHKDYPTFIDAIAKLVKMNLPVRAFAIGDGSLKNELMRVVQERSLDQHIIFTGFRKDIVRILPGLDVFLITSETEGLGTSILDAFAAGVPVVATNAGGIPEMVEHRITGMLCRVKDSDCLANAVAELVANAHLRAELTGEAKRKLHEFTKSNTARKTLEIYNEVLNQRTD
ncbi:MAG TPA: glycosyltransferase family 4 protein, partial [Chryseosolibacter sp.]|nr:glycosyltransferase family 4 protein [Chryseosolibacter sp.]